MKHPLPDASLDGRLCIVGISGSGKSTTAKGGVERLLKQGRRVCIVDLLDGWWGLRLRRDGKSPAFPVAIFGGLHGDLPLTEHAGALIGQAVAQSEGSSIVSLAELDGDAPRRRFALAFFDALHKANRAPLHLLVDEADFYAPQQPVKDGPGPMLLNRVKEIAARGRMRGFRLWSVTQRPAKLHKDVMSQADTLVAMQLTSSQDRGALKAWIGDQGDESVGTGILRALPTLKRGEGVVWSPRLGVLETTHFPLPDTYDSSRTPEYGETAASVELKPIDLGALREKLGKVDAEVKANDPAALKAEVRRLTAELATKPSVAAVVNTAEIDRAFAAGVEQGLAEAMGHCRDALLTQAQRLQDLAQKGVVAAADEMRVAGQWRCPRTAVAPTPGITHARQPFIQAPTSAPAVSTSRAATVSTAGTLKPALQRVVNAIGWWRQIGQDPVDRSRACVVAGLSPKASTFGVYIGELIKLGLVESSPGKVGLTTEGLALAVVPAGDTREQIHDVARGLLGPQEQRVFDAIYAVYPKEIARVDLANAVGLSPTASTLGVYIGGIAAYGIIENGSRGHVRAAGWLFP